MATARRTARTRAETSATHGAEGGGENGLRGWPRRPPRLATAVVADLVDRIVGGELPPGSGLPIEPILGEMFGVSRTVIREAIKTLEGMRLVRVQQGQGTTVRDVDEWNLLNPVVLAGSVRHDAELAILDDLVRVRSALEGDMAGQAARNADAAHLDAIRAALAKVQAEERDTARFFRADLAFHAAIMAASGNRLGRAVVDTVNAEAFGSMRYVGEPTRADLRQSNVEHEAILDRLVAHDEDGAAIAMSEHILRSWHKRRPRRRRGAAAVKSRPGKGKSTARG
jgi:GntR family galactonate operon transcriptional repressor